ncbi:unnamed protein product [Plutella xylostella]|uniref:(diamondback moth) hypothetical protein n=1 Tax=Plutella xylostella TaxID=51655 RepID=A0A8S4DXM8_PLUXY|nr:unnamed protein product [Plutella xylostella]
MPCAARGLSLGCRFTHSSVARILLRDIEYHFRGVCMYVHIPARPRGSHSPLPATTMRVFLLVFVVMMLLAAAFGDGETEASDAAGMTEARTDPALADVDPDTTKPSSGSYVDKVKERVEAEKYSQTG